jgi:hypothetical protein
VPCRDAAGTCRASQTSPDAYAHTRPAGTCRRIVTRVRRHLQGVPDVALHLAHGLGAPHRLLHRVPLLEPRRLRLPPQHLTPPPEHVVSTSAGSDCPAPTPINAPMAPAPDLETSGAAGPSRAGTTAASSSGP